MRIVIPQQRRPRRSISHWAAAGLLLGALALLWAHPLPAQQQAVGKPARHKASHTQGHSAPASSPLESAQNQAPAAPKPPDWPVNDSPGKATVVWDSHGLSIDAKNSSLRQILDDVATATGTRVEGMGTDARIFGIYGPGPARDILSQLLHGSEYNVLMIGGQGTEPPKQLVLSVRPKGGAPPPGNTQPAASDEPPPEAEEPPQQPVQINPGFNPNQGPRSPQQIMREMLQRQQQLRQQMNPPQ